MTNSQNTRPAKVTALDLLIGSSSLFAIPAMLIFSCVISPNYNSESLPSVKPNAQILSFKHYQSAKTNNANTNFYQGRIGTPLPELENR